MGVRVVRMGVRVVRTAVRVVCMAVRVVRTAVRVVRTAVFMGDRASGRLYCRVYSCTSFTPGEMSKMRSVVALAV